MKLRMRRSHHSTIDEQGFASIVIALVLIVVLSLLTVAFAQLARREQQSALDKQLAAQANYAAETGINDAVHDIRNINNATGCPYIYDNDGPGCPGTDASDSQCMGPAGGSVLAIPTGAATYNSVIDNTSGVSYSCLLVNLHPNNIVFGNVAANSSRYIKYSYTSPIDTMIVSWGSADIQAPQYPLAGGNGPGYFVPADQWSTKQYPPVIAFTVVPLGSVDRTSLMNRSFTTYLYPSTAGPGSVRYTQDNLSSQPAGNNNQGQIQTGGCSGVGTYTCKVTITSMPSDTDYLVYFTAYYDKANISIEGRDLSNTNVPVGKGQAQIDVTGRAKNVLKRLQVRVPLQDVPSLPIALEGQSICKRLTVYSGTGTAYSTSTYATPLGALANPCDLSATAY